MRPLSNEGLASTGPVTQASHLFAPFDPDYLQNPYPTLARIRAEEPIFFSPELGTWVVTRHETIRGILRDTQRYSARPVNDPLRPLCPHARGTIEQSGFDVPPMLANNDPPSHTRYRKLYSAPLQRERLLALEPYIRQVTDQYIDRLEAMDRPADLVAAMTWELPALVALKLLGVPDEDVVKVKTWAESRLVLVWGRPKDEDQVRLTRSTIDFYKYAKDLVQRKLTEPGDDWISDILRLRDGDDSRISLHELSGMAFNLLFAGHETTSSAAASMFARVLADRDLWQGICRGAVPLAPLTEEIIRLDAPIQALRRLTKADVVVDGVALPAGSRVLMLFASSNRDPSVFDHPDDIDLERKNAIQHQGFGGGVHYCMGAPIARLELQVMLERMAQRLPGMELVAGQKLEYVPNMAVRALKKLLVTW